MVPFSWPNHFPKASTSNTITLGLEFYDINFEKTHITHCTFYRGIDKELVLLPQNRYYSVIRKQTMDAYHQPRG
jgi:hypothetical protein